MAQFRFLKADTVGAAAAEDDQEFLQDCFVDTGDLKRLSDCANTCCIVVGRTGAGKTALLQQLDAEAERCIPVDPETLALPHISNSTILRFFSDLGVKLDVFFRLLWRHVLTVELLRYHFQLQNEDDKRSLITRLAARFKNRRHRKALEYLERWGESFWRDTDYRTKELTTKLETKLRGAAGAKVGGAEFSAGAAKCLSVEEKREVVERAQTVVNDVQIRELADVMTMLDEVLDDPQKSYLITIDRLDEDWVEDQLRYRLIRALIDTVREMRRVRHAKVIVAIRLDLLERVFRLTRDSGFQKEKLESLYLRLQWNHKQLSDLMERRLVRLVRHRYSKKKAVSFRDLFPQRIEESTTVDYILARTMMRPRDAIQFLNACIRHGSDRQKLSVTMVREAEGDYSRDRLHSLADEWHPDYPNLITFTKLLRGFHHRFRIAELSDLRR